MFSIAHNEVTITIPSCPKKSGGGVTTFAPQQGYLHDHLKSIGVSQCLFIDLNFLMSYFGKIRDEDLNFPFSFAYLALNNNRNNMTQHPAQNRKRNHTNFPRNQVPILVFERLPVTHAVC